MFEMFGLDPDGVLSLNLGHSEVKVLHDLC